LSIGQHVQLAYSAFGKKNLLQEVSFQSSDLRTSPISSRGDW